MIPILIAGPLVFIFFRMEQLYFQGKLPFSLVIFWVTAWVFTLDLMYLCHWFTYEDIPIDPNQPILADDQFIDGQVSSDDNMLPPKIDIEQGPLSSSSGSILNAPDTKRTSPRATLQPGSSVFNMARRASSMMISPQMGGMMGMGAQMGGMLGVGTQVTGMLGVGSQMGMSGGGCRSSIMPGLYPPQMMQMRPSLVPGDPVSQRSTGGGSAKARASILNKRKDIAEPTRAIESPNAALTSPNEALETLEEDDSNSSAGSLPVVAMNFPGDQGSQSSLTKSSASEASDAYEPPPNFRLPPTTEEEDEEHDQFDVSASPGAFTFTAIATPVIEEKGLELNEISITVDEGDNDNKKWSLEKVSTPAEIPKMQSKPAVSAPTGFLSTGLTDGVRRLSRAVFGSPAASEQRLSFALSISPSIAPSMATSEAPSDPDKSRPLRRKSTRKSVFPVFQPGRRVSRAIVYNPNDAYGMAQMFSNASRRISVRSDDSADAGSSTLSVNEKHIVIAEKEDVKFSAFDPFDNSVSLKNSHTKQHKLIVISIDCS